MKALAVTAGIVFWTLVLGVAWLAFFPGRNSSEPIAVLQVERPAEPGSAAMPPDDAGEVSPPQAASPGAEPAPGDVELPPGFAVTGPPAEPQAPAQPQAPAPPAEPPPGTSMMPMPGGLDAPAPPTPADPPPSPDDRRGEAPEPSEPGSPEVQEAALDVPSEHPVAPPPAATQATVAETVEAGEETGSITLGPVPVAALVEESQYGPLPKVATDGRRPVEVYARPSPHARAGGAGPVRIAVLLNGLGLPGSPDGDVLEGLPPDISVAYGAYGRSLQDWVSKARAAGHEVLLQIPLEPNDYPNEDPGPHTLLTTLPTHENIKRLQWLMSRYTGYVGVTNHMGAKFETTKEALLPVLEEVKRRGLLYVDDGSVNGSAAGQVATTLGLDYSMALVQIDSGQSAADIAKALAQLEAMAQERGAAIGVVQAKPETVKHLTEWAGKLEGKGIVLVPVSAAVRSQRQS